MEDSPPHVLVVDDDPVIVRLLELNFRLGGFRVSSATRGDRAVERAIEAEPDAIVLDVTMPGIDGYEVTRSLREEHGMVRCAHRAPNGSHRGGGPWPGAALRASWPT